MNIGRPWIVAAQVVVVGVLVGVVYLTLLRPEDDGDLSGVDAPSGNPQITQGPEQRSDRNQRDGERGRDRRVGGGGGGGPEARPGTSLAPPSALAPAPAPPPAAPAPTAPPPSATTAPPDDGPVGDQYQDALGRITAELY